MGNTKSLRWQCLFRKTMKRCVQMNCDHLPLTYWLDTPQMFVSIAMKIKYRTEEQCSPRTVHIYQKIRSKKWEERGKEGLAYTILSFYTWYSSVRYDISVRHERKPWDTCETNPECETCDVNKWDISVEYQARVIATSTVDLVSTVPLIRESRYLSQSSSPLMNTFRLAHTNICGVSSR